MRWFARPDHRSLELRVTPRLASWNTADDPDQLQLQKYLDDTEAFIAGERIDSPWALRLDVGLPSSRDLRDASDLDTYAYPPTPKTGPRAPCEGPFRRAGLAGPRTGDPRGEQRHHLGSSAWDATIRRGQTLDFS